MIWLGGDLGLNKLVPSREQFTLYRHKPSDPNSLSGNFVKPITEDRQGLLWVGTDGAGLNRLVGAIVRMLQDDKEEQW